MARFIGTEKEFNRYIGPILRNIVQQLSRNMKNAVGECQFCGSKSNLEAAHKHDRGRKKIIETILSDYKTQNYVDIDLTEFEMKFKVNHSNEMENTFFILCKDCHNDYDKSNSILPLQLNVENESPKIIEINRIYTNSDIQELISNELKMCDIDILADFCKEDYSKEVFGINFCLLKKIPSNLSKTEKDKYLKDKGIKRWSLKYLVKRDGFDYALSTQWYSKNDILVKKWLNRNNT
jgi:5-methylcytosine-specific restriction endonuclease McrA